MTQSSVHHLLVLILIFFILAFPVSAQIVISEIMYAPNEGVAHEWFEIFNNGDSEIDLTDWRFSDGSNHVFGEPPKNGGQGSLIISSNEYAIVAKEADTFLSTHSGFSSTVIDGSFSLTDTGDTLSLIDDEGVVIDTVSYAEDAGAKKNELSLQLIDGAWSPEIPTPGSGSLSVSQPAPSDQGDEVGDSTESSSSSSTDGVGFSVEPQIFASAGGDRVVTVGASSLFKGEAVGIVGKKLENARFVWNFGDGTRKEGASVLHYYHYPGEYIATLDVSSGEYMSSDRVKVSVNEAKLAVSRGTPDVITISNLGDYEVDLSWWLVVVNGTSFVLPKNTVVIPQHEIHLSSEVTRLYPVNSSAVALQYPNGREVVLHSTGYKEQRFENTPIASNSSLNSQRSIVGSEIPTTYGGADYPDEIIEDTKDEDVSSQVANVSESVGAKEGTEPMFWLALVGIIIFGSLSAVVLRRESQNEIKIIE